MSRNQQMEISQSASRPRSRSQVQQHPSTVPCCSSRETMEEYDDMRLRAPVSRAVTKTVSASLSETQPQSSEQIETPRPNEMLREIQKRYRFDPIPSVQQYRLMTTLSGYRLTLDAMKPRKQNLYFSFGMRMGEDPILLKKVVVTPQHGDIRLFTPAIEIGILRLQFALGYDWQKNSFGASWRCKTKWTNGSRIQKRFQLYTKNNMEVSTFWNIRQQLPQIGGQIGPSSATFIPDLGQLHLDMDRLKAAIHF